jgi:hypothetical protein
MPLYMQKTRRQLSYLHTQYVLRTEVLQLSCGRCTEHWLRVCLSMNVVQGRRCFETVALDTNASSQTLFRAANLQWSYWGESGHLAAPTGITDRCVLFHGSDEIIESHAQLALNVEDNLCSYCPVPFLHTTVNRFCALPDFTNCKNYKKLETHLRRSVFICESFNDAFNSFST